MTEREFELSLRKSYRLFTELGKCKSFISSTSLPINKDFNSIALDTSIAYPEIYFHGLKLNQFNFSLKDYSYFQFSYQSEKDLRYAFYPSPFGSKEMELINELIKDFENQMLDQEEFESLMQNININYARPLLRYEYNEKQYKKGHHPASHLHLGTYGEDRWCIQKRLSPYAFSLVVAKHYFGEDWESLTEFDATGDRIRNPFDEELFNERRNCLITPIEKFSDHESWTFHIS